MLAHQRRAMSSMSNSSVLSIMPWLPSTNPSARLPAQANVTHSTQRIAGIQERQGVHLRAHPDVAGWLACHALSLVNSHWPPLCCQSSAAPPPARPAPDLLPNHPWQLQRCLAVTVTTHSLTAECCGLGPGLVVVIVGVAQLHGHDDAADATHLHSMAQQAHSMAQQARSPQHSTPGCRCRG